MIKLQKHIILPLKILFILLILFHFYSPTKAQSKNLRFDHLSIKDGLPDDGLKTIIQDHLGFLWIATRNGLSKYDGYNFINYQNDPNDSNSIAGNNVRSIMEDSQGDIWVGTFDGLSILLRKDDNFVNYEHYGKDSNSLSHNWIRTMLEDKHGSVWLGTRGGGINVVRKEHVRNKKKKMLFQPIVLDRAVQGTEQIIDIMEDSEGDIWACTRNGLIRILDGKVELIQPIKSSISIPENSFFTIVQDEEKNFWLGTNGRGIALFNKVKNSFHFFTYDSLPFRNYSPNNIMSLLIDSKGNLWAGPKRGETGGLFLFDRKTRLYTSFQHDNLNPSSISEDNAYVQTIMEDNVGNIWITAHEGKLNKLNPQKNIFKYYRNYLRSAEDIMFSKQTRMLVARNGRIWFTAWNGLYEFLPSKNEFIKINTHNKSKDCGLDTKCWGIVEDNEGNLWTAGNQAKLRIYNPATNKASCFEENGSLSNPNVFCILPDKDGIIWFGTWKGGLDRYDPYKKEIQNLPSVPNDNSTISDWVILKMCEDSSDHIWIATNDGNLNKLNKKTLNVERILISKYTGYICKLFTDSQNRLWAGTNVGGIFLFNTSDNSYKRINTKNGLPSDHFVTGFSEDHHGNIYCCTGSYLIKLNKDGIVEKYYDIAQSDEVLHTTFYIKKTKEIFIISDKGLYRFYVDSLKPNLIPPNIVLTDIKLFDNSLEIGDESPLTSHINIAKEIALEHWQNDISFEYAALHYINPKENKYKYVLENYDDEWKEAGTKREATYTNLSHGQYTFKVLGSNSDGIWAKEPATLSITILPPWWKTWWAYILYAIVIISLLSYLYYLQRRRLKFRHEFEMKEFEAVKLKEVDQLKSSFFANISHEFRTPLTLIKGPVEQLLEGKKLEDPNKTFRMIKRNSERLLNLINELLDLSKLESGKMKLSAQKADIVSFSKSIAMSFESIAERKKMQVNFRSSNEMIEVYFDKEKLQMIITNLLSNAFKFTKENGIININVDENNNKVNIKIKDDGIGIPKEDLPKIFDRFYQVSNNDHTDNIGTGIGLSLTKELVEMHHGEILVTSEPGNGSEFIVSLPLGRAHLKDEDLIYIVEGERAEQIESYEEEVIANEEDSQSKAVVLVVEDNKDVREFISDILKIDFEIKEAEDGEEGMKKAIECMPDLIISDIMMPKLSGDLMCSRLKKDPITSHIPIILLTAKASDEDKIDGLKIGADDYLIKPFNEKELLARINNLIAQRKKLREKYLREAEIHPAEVAVTSYDKKFIERAISIVEENISDTNFSVEQFASELLLSKAQLYRKFKSILGEKPNEFIRKYRIKRAAELIKQNYGNITQIAYEVGFNDLSYFTKCFKKVYNITPHRYEQELS